MKMMPAVLMFGLCLLPVAASAQAMNADDMKWVNACIKDNTGEPGATPAIVRAYCVCMTAMRMRVRDSRRCAVGLAGLFFRRDGVDDRE